MASPLSVIENAQLTFRVPQLSTERTEYGNPGADALTPLVVTAYLKRINGSAATVIASQFGRVNESFFYRGRCITPLFLPIELRAGVEAEAEIEGLSGRFYLIPNGVIDTAQRFFPSIGQKLEGVLVTRTWFGGRT